MKNKWFNIILASLLTFAVTDAVWVDLFQDDQVVAEFETEKETEAEKEVRSERIGEDKHDFFSFNSLGETLSLCIRNISTGFVKHGNSYNSQTNSKSPKLYIQQCKLKLHC